MNKFLAHGLIAVLVYLDPATWIAQQAKAAGNPLIANCGCISPDGRTRAAYFLRKPIGYQNIVPGIQLDVVALGGDCFLDCAGWQKVTTGNLSMLVQSATEQSGAGFEFVVGGTAN